MAKQLIAKQFQLVAADTTGKAPNYSVISPPLILAMGNEGNGLSERFRSMASHFISIPVIKDGAESLNVAAAGAICIYELGPKPAGSRKTDTTCQA
jgi:tRNA G18 (ribose-2'-O)-methylase SpoU